MPVKGHNPVKMAEDPVRPLRIGVQRKILLLLRENMRFVDDYEVPEILSQKGMGRELELRQNHLSRALSELNDEGLVGSKTAHIKGVGRKRKIYFLKEKGILEVNNYIQSIRNRKVPVRLPNGGLKLYPISNVMDLIHKSSGIRPSIFQLLTKYYDGSEVNLVIGRKDTAGQGPPLTRYFFGRERELSDLKRAMESTSIPIVTVISLAGMGKTTLMSRLISPEERSRMEWTLLSDWSGPERILTKWSRFLGTLGRTSLLDFIGRRVVMDLEEAVDRLLEDLRGLNAVLVLDDYQRTSGRIDDILSLILRKSNECGFTILIGSRERPGFYGNEDIRITGKVMELTLEGLDRDSSMAFLEEIGVPIPERERIYELTKGHPLSIELMCRSCLEDPMVLTREVEEYLGRELISGLNENEREVLYLAAAFEEPVARDALLIVSGAGRQVLESLKEKLVLRVYPDGTMDIHDLLKYNLRQWMGEELFSEYTERAISYLSGRGSVREILHFLALLDRSERYEEMDRLFLERGEEFIETGNPLIVDRISTMDGSQLIGRARVSFLILKADIEILSGDLEMSREKLEEASRLVDSLSSSSDDDIEVLGYISRIFNLKAEIARLMGKEKEAIFHHLENVSRNRKQGDAKSLGKALNNLGMSYKNAGQLNRAASSLIEASELFRGNDNQVSLAMVKANLSEVMVMKGDAGKARKYLSEADRIAVRSLKVESRLKRKTARARMLIRDYKGALKDLQRAYTICTEDGDRYGAVSVLCDIVKISLKRRDPASAQSNLRDMVPFITGAGSGDKWVQEVAWCFLRNLNSMGDAEISRELVDSISPVMETILNGEAHMITVRSLGVIREKNPDSMAIESTLEEAARKLARDKDPHASIVVSLWMAEDLIRKGDKKKAGRVLEGIIRNSRSIGFGKALTKAQKMLKES